MCQKSLMKSDRKKLVKRLDDVFSSYIRNRDNHVCVTCGSQLNSTCGHLFSRVNYSTRWDEDNAFCQCAGCNYRHEFEPYPFFKFYIKKFGQKKLDEMDFKHRQVKKFSNSDLKDMIDLYKDKLADIICSKNLPF